MTATYAQTGGARLDSLNASWPFAKLLADAECLRLSCLGREYLFPRNSICKLSRHRGVFSIGLRIEHREQSAPEFIIFWASIFFWTAGFRKLKEQLENLGYEIQS